MKKFQLYALVAVSAGIVQAAETPLMCGPREACAPPPISLGDEPTRDGPRGPVGPSSFWTTAASSVTGPTGPVAPYPT
jgi:hypothetical protein